MLGMLDKYKDKEYFQDTTDGGNTYGDEYYDLDDDGNVVVVDNTDAGVGNSNAGVDNSDAGNGDTDNGDAGNGDTDNGDTTPSDNADDYNDDGFDKNGNYNILYDRSIQSNRKFTKKYDTSMADTLSIIEFVFLLGILISHFFLGKSGGMIVGAIFVFIASSIIMSIIMFVTSEQYVKIFFGFSKTYLYVALLCFAYSANEQSKSKISV